VDDGLETVGITEEEEEQDTNVDQPIHQEVSQEAIDQSEENDQDDDNIQTQTGVDDQEIAQGTADGNDLAESS
jgi:L-lysine 2,3-aminomutase